MVRRGTGLYADQAWPQLLEESYDVAPLQLPADDDLTFRINAVDLENRLGDIETDCRNRLHVWLLQIVGALTAPTFMALTCRWRSRPQRQLRTSVGKTGTSCHSRPFYDQREWHGLSLQYRTFARMPRLHAHLNVLQRAFF